MNRFVFIAIVSLFLPACTDQLAPSTFTASIKSVAVVAIVPADISLTTAGTIVFQNDLDLVEVPDWHLQKVANDAASEALRSHLSVVQVTTDPGLGGDIATLSSSLAEEVRTKVHPKAPVDAYLVIWSDPAAGSHDPRRAGVGSIGVMKDRGIFISFSPTAYTFLGMTLLDGKSFKTMGRWELEISSGRPVKTMPALAWKNHWNEMSAAEHDEIRSVLQALLTEAITYSIHTIWFGGHAAS